MANFKQIRRFFKTVIKNYQNLKIPTSKQIGTSSSFPFYHNVLKIIIDKENPTFDFFQNSPRIITRVSRAVRILRNFRTLQNEAPTTFQEPELKRGIIHPMFSKNLLDISKPIETIKKECYEHVKAELNPELYEKLKPFFINIKSFVYNDLFIGGSRFIDVIKMSKSELSKLIKTGDYDQIQEDFVAIKFYNEVSADWFFQHRNYETNEEVERFYRRRVDRFVNEMRTLEFISLINEKAIRKIMVPRIYGFRWGVICVNGFKVFEGPMIIMQYINGHHPKSEEELESAIEQVKLLSQNCIDHGDYSLSNIIIRGSNPYLIDFINSHIRREPFIPNYGIQKLVEEFKER